MEETNNHCNLLRDPLSISDLIGNGTRIELNTDFEDRSIDNMYDELYGSDEGENDNEIERTSLVSPWTKPFAELIPEMEAINEYMHKRIIVQGNKEKGLMPEKSRVNVRYNAYWEGNGAPFDSSFLRGSIYSFYTGQGNVICGLEKAVATMYEGEESQFIISYQLLFGEMGCPPRIGKKADGLFIISLASFNAVGDINAEKEISAEDRTKYKVVVEKAREIHIKGLDFFGQGMHKNASRAFEKAVNILSCCRLENEEEDREQNHFLVKLYTNLAVCYNKLNMPSKTCMMCREIRRLTNNHPSCKAIFQEGRALLMLGDFRRSRDLLVRAQRMEPHNECINQELTKLDTRFKNYAESERLICQKAMGSDPKNISKKPEEMTEFKQSMMELLGDFKNSQISEKFELPSGLTDYEIKTVDELAKELEMRLEFSPLTKSHSISKK